MDNENIDIIDKNPEQEVEQKIYRGASNNEISGAILAGLVFQIVGSIFFFIVGIYLISRFNKLPNYDQMIILMFYIFCIIIPIVCIILSIIALITHNRRLIIIVMYLGFHVSMAIGFGLIYYGLNNRLK